MSYVRLADIIGCMVVSSIVLYGAIIWSTNLLVLGGFTAFVYGCMVFSPGLGGRMGALCITPFLALFTFVVMVLSADLLLSGVLAAGAVRAGMLVWADAGRTRTHPLPTS